MGTRVDIKGDKYIITSTVTDESTKPLSKKEAIADRVCGQILDHRMEVLKLYMRFPFQYCDSSLKIHCTFDMQKSSHDYFEVSMAIYRMDNWWEVSKEIYDAIIAILEDDEKEYIPYQEIAPIKKILDNLEKRLQCQED